MGQAQGEFAVIGQEKEAPALAVEATHREEPLGRRDEIKDRLPPAGIGAGAQVSGWLVEQDIALPGGDMDGLPIHPNAWIHRVDVRSRPRGRASDGDAPGGDQRVGLAPRRDARAG